MTLQGGVLTKHASLFFRQNARKLHAILWIEINIFKEVTL